MPSALNIIKNNKHAAFAMSLLAFIMLGLLMQTVQLGTWVPFHDWDEAIYAQVAREFARSPGIAQTYNGSLWFEKPPLPTWLYSIAWIMPVARPEIMARLITFFLSSFGLLLLFDITRVVTQSKRFGAIAVLIAVQSAMYRDRSELVNVDIMLTVGWLLYLWGVTQKHYVARVIGTLIGTLSKSLLGLIPLLVEFGVDIALRVMTPKKFLRFLITALLGVSWHVFMIARYGEAFIQSHFIDHLVSRVTRPIELHFGDKWYYLTKLFWENPWFVPIACFGLTIGAVSLYQTWKARRKIATIHNSSLILAALIPLGYLALLTISKSKLHWYLTPLLPFIGFWAAYALHTIYRFLSVRHVVSGSLLIISIVLYGGITFALRTQSIQPDWFTPTDKTKIGQCVGIYATPDDRITYLVPSQERIDANVIEAAQLQIGSSFIYGSAPAFLYYADAPTTFVYRLERLAEDIQYASIVVIPITEMNTKTISSIVNARSPKRLCRNTTFVAYRLQ